MVDLLIALREYPEAIKTFREGTELLGEDNLFDEKALEELESAEKVTEELQSFVRIQQIRKDFVHSDVDEQLLFSVPFTADGKNFV
ncbi:unnamed protein product [Meloidogyne enterolobii]|uniref:Uncharacterized protein n=1 Tax=Meloidogyne enterolobii TaxID=390850 RepID=A0ACB1AP08_MELEN